MSKPDKKINPHHAPILRYFDTRHLPPKLAIVSKPVGELARAWASNDKLDARELNVALRKLLEAKDAAVRAALDA